jgi:hypothetical protein
MELINIEKLLHIFKPVKLYTWNFGDHYQVRMSVWKYIFVNEIYYVIMLKDVFGNPYL